MRADARWLWTGLGLSVLLNLFLAGMAAGGWLAPHPAAGQGGLAPGARVRRLPMEERTRFAAAMKPHRPAIKTAREAVRAARAKVEADMTAPTYDAAATSADLAALRQANADLQAQVHGGLVEALGRLSPASRASLVDRAREAREARVGNAPPAR